MEHARLDTREWAIVAAAQAAPPTPAGDAGHRLIAAIVNGPDRAAVKSFLRNPVDPLDKETPDLPMAKDEFVLKFVKPGAGG